MRTLQQGDDFEDLFVKSADTHGNEIGFADYKFGEKFIICISKKSNAAFAGLGNIHSYPFDKESATKLRDDLNEYLAS